MDFASISSYSLTNYIFFSFNSVSNTNYAPVSETSDDMYAAIEDPTYLPTGNQSNSDTYAVINLPEDEIDDNEEVALRSAHMYSKVDRNRKVSFSKKESLPCFFRSNLKFLGKNGLVLRDHRLLNSLHLYFYSFSTFFITQKFKCSRMYCVHFYNYIALLKKKIAR